MPANDLQDIFLGRQPILDRHQQLFAYELLFRNRRAEEGNSARFSDSNQATATVIAHAFTEFSMADALGAYQGFIRFDRGLLFSDLVHALPQRSVVLELQETVELTPETLARCEQLQRSGFVLAARERPELHDPAHPLLRLVQIVKVDTQRVNADGLRGIARTMKPLGKTLLAEKVETREAMQQCHDLGFDLFEGYYFARPTVIQGKRLKSSEGALLKLLALLAKDADSAEIEAVFKQEPVLTVNLLRLTNSAGSGMSTRISSLQQAIMLLGRRQLLRWLQLLLYSGISSGSPGVNPLLQLVATRGRLMELLADRTPEAPQGGRELIDQAYMTGILSLMPTLIGGTMADVLAQLPVARLVHDALSDRVGVLGDLLCLVEYQEHPGSDEDAEKTDALLARYPQIDANYTNACLAKALTWANNLAREAS